MRQELFKIIDEKYCNNMLDGNLYMNTLNYFRNSEDNKAQGDIFEGIIGTINPNQQRQYGFSFNESILSMFKGGLILRSDVYGFFNVFCLYQLNVNDENKTVQIPSKKLTEFVEDNSPNKVVVRIKDRIEFISRIEKAIEQEIAECKHQFAVYGNVVYENIWQSADEPGYRGIFHKDPSYSYQNEWRLTMLRNSMIDEAYTLNIGSIRDITEVMSLEVFLNNPEKIYGNDYIGINEPKSYKPNKNIYRILGEINAASKLMYSYMPKQPQHTGLSDEALADFHYTKYLELSGRKDEISVYLEKAFMQHLDMEYLFLYADYLNANGIVDSAINAFRILMKENPEAIESDAEKYFFLLHQLLMKDKDVESAAKMYYASLKYKICDHLQNGILSDCLFGLGFYDKAVKIYLDMKKENNDPIIDFYLAITYLHLLQFDKAAECLNHVKSLYTSSDNLRYNLGIAQQIIDSFLKDKPIPEKMQEDFFEELEWDDNIKTHIEECSSTEFYINLDILCTIGKYDNWDLLNDVKHIEIVPQTISELMERYIVSGNIDIFNVLQRLSKLKNLHINSPDLMYFLAVDCENPELDNNIKAQYGVLMEKMAEKLKKD